MAETYRSRADRERIDAIVDAFPTRRYKSAAQLLELKGFELVSELRELGVSRSTFTAPDKSDLHAALVQRRDSACAVCLADFDVDEAYRNTLCGHSFHDCCLRSAALHEFDMSCEMPHCPSCRSQIDVRPAAVRLAQSSSSTNHNSTNRKSKRRFVGSDTKSRGGFDFSSTDFDDIIASLTSADGFRRI